MRWLFAVLFVLTLVPGCGGSGSDGYGGGDGSPTPPQPDAAWDAAKPSFTRACTKCHNGSTQPLDFNKKAVVLGVRNKIVTRLEAGTMPPAGNALSAEDKAAILAYVKG